MSTKATPKVQADPISDPIQEIDRQLAAIGDPVAKERAIAEKINKILEDQKAANDRFDAEFAAARDELRAFMPERARLTERARQLRLERERLTQKK